MLGDGLDRATLSTARDGADLPRHQWYAVKEAFSPRLLSLSLEQRPESAVVLDPFVGSGTVTVESASSGIRSLGIEVNPFLRFVARAKLTRASQRSLRRAADRARSSIDLNTRSPLEGLSTFTHSSAKRGLFNRDVLRAAHTSIAGVSADPPDTRRPVQLALVAAAMACCNAVRDGKCLRYRESRVAEQYGREAFVAEFDQRMTTIIDDVERVPLEARSRVLAGDARVVTRRLSREAFDVVLTSPPYLNSWDYTDIYRPELFVGGFISSAAELHALRLRTIRSHVQAAWPRPRRFVAPVSLQSALADLDGQAEHLWDHRLPVMVRAYFSDMASLLRALRQRAKKGASVWLVVSTSAYGGVHIPVDLVVADIGAAAGWHLRELAVLRELRSSGQHWRRRRTAEDWKRPPLRESLIVLDADPGQTTATLAPGL